MPNYRVSFKKATDDISGQSDLLYKLFISSQDNLNDPETIEFNGTKLTQEYNIDEFIVDITTTDNVYLNVSVEDGAGNKSLYNRIFLQGGTGGDTTPPTVSNPTLTSKNIIYKSIEVTFNRAIDNQTPQADLKYYLYKSSTNNLNTVSNVESNGTLVDFKTNQTKLVIPNLEYNEVVWFNVIVEDLSGNKTAYNQSANTVFSQPENIDQSFSSFLNVAVNPPSYFVEESVIKLDFISTIYPSASIQIKTIKNKYLLDFVDLIPKYEGKIIQGKYINDSVLLNSSFESIPITPVISDRNLSITNLTINNYTVNFNSATDDETADENLIYTLYEGDPQSLNDIDLIESQRFLASAVNVNSFVVNATEGDFVSGNILVEDQAGNKAIYNGFTQLIPERSIEHLLINESDFTLEEGGQETFDFSIDIIAFEGADDTVTVTSSDPTVVAITELTPTTFRATLQTPISQQTAVNIQAVSNFDPSKTDTITATCIPHTIETPQESDTFEFITIA